MRGERIHTENEWKSKQGKGGRKGRSRNVARSAGTSTRVTRIAGKGTRSAGRVRSGQGRNAGGQEETPGTGEGQGSQETKGMSPYRADGKVCDDIVRCKIREMVRCVTILQ